MGDNRRLSSGLLLGITVFGLLAVVYLRLVPFDLSFSGGGLDYLIDQFSWQPLSIRDIPTNLLIFIPFSFGLAGLLHQAGWSWSRLTAVTVLTTLLIGIGVEALQAYIPERVPSVTDILANGLSALIGIGLYRLAIFGVRRAIVRYASPVTVIALLAIYAGVVALFTTYLLWSAGLSTWDDSYPLTLGNEASDFRPWEGRIADVLLMTRAVSAAEATAIMAGEVPADALAFYDLSQSAPFDDSHQVLPDLLWQPPDAIPQETENASALVGADQWLSSNGAVASFSRQARDGSAFTLVTEFAADRLRQRGPARIVTVSADEAHRNVTLGQQGDALTFRIRTPSSGVNGQKPEMVIPGFFTAPSAHRVALTYDTPTLRVFVNNSATSYAVSMAPGLALFQDFQQTNRWLLEFPANPQLYNYRYWSLMVIPALLVAALLIAIRDAAIGRTVVPVSIVPRD